MKKTDLAKFVDKTPSAVSQFESGSAKPDAATIASLALALQVPVGFFARSPLLTSAGLEHCHFRSLRSTSQYLRRQVIRVGELVHEVLEILEQEGIELPADQVTPSKQQTHTDEEIEQLAAAVRRQWGMGLGPIPDAIRLVEAKGIRVLPLADVCEQVDAFSMWHAGKPFMMLALQKASSRIQFDVAHELGHLLMHEDVSPADPEAEREADRFAAAFLLPRESFIRECPTRWNLSTFRALKRRWYVSIQGLVVRAHQLGRLSLSSYRRAFVNLNQYGMRRDEPDEWPLNPPSVLRKALDLVAADLPLRDIADRLALHERDLLTLLAPVMAQD